MLFNDRTEIVLDAKYLRVLLHSMELANGTPAPSPSVAGFVTQKPDDDDDLDVQECRLYRGIVGSLPYLSIDRCDVQFETPTKAPRTRLNQSARYLAGTQSARLVLVKPGTDCDPHEAFLPVWLDSDWARNVKDRTSQSSLKIDVDGCPLSSASRKQKARVHSSGEAENYAAASAASEGILIREVLLFMGMEARTSRREGVGTIRRLSGYSSWWDAELSWLEHAHPQRTLPTRGRSQCPPSGCDS